MLWALPFETLIDPKARYLIESTTIGYAPSLAALVWPASQGAVTICSGSGSGSPRSTGLPMLALRQPDHRCSVRARYGDTRRELKLNAMPEAAPRGETRRVSPRARPVRRGPGLHARKSTLDPPRRLDVAAPSCGPGVLSDASPMFSETAAGAGPGAPADARRTAGTGRRRNSDRRRADLMGDTRRSRPSCRALNARRPGPATGEGPDWSGVGVRCGGLPDGRRSHGGGPSRWRRPD